MTTKKLFICNFCTAEIRSTNGLGLEWRGAVEPGIHATTSMAAAENHLCLTCAKALAEELHRLFGSNPETRVARSSQAERAAGVECSLSVPASSKSGGSSEHSRGAEVERGNEIAEVAGSIPAHQSNDDFEIPTFLRRQKPAGEAETQAARAQAEV